MSNNNNNNNKLKEYNYGDVRQHNQYNSAWIAIHGVVYDVTKFTANHPGGDIIHTAFGRDGTILFETHHNCSEQMDKIKAVMKKYEIGIIKDYKPVCVFDSPFAKALLSRVKDKIKGKHLRSSFYGLS